MSLVPLPRLDVHPACSLAGSRCGPERAHAQSYLFFFFFNDTATTEIYTAQYTPYTTLFRSIVCQSRNSSLSSLASSVAFISPETGRVLDRKSTRLNSSHIEPSRMPSSA